jgi:hypothetical protein
VIAAAAGYLKLKEKQFSKADVLRTFACLIDVTYFSDENTTVNGTVHIIDFNGYGLAHQTFLSLEERRDFMHTWQVRKRPAFVHAGNKLSSIPPMRGHK